MRVQTILVGTVAFATVVGVAVTPANASPAAHHHSASAAPAWSGNDPVTSRYASLAKDPVVPATRIIGAPTLSRVPAAASGAASSANLTRHTGVATATPNVPSNVKVAGTVTLTPVVSATVSSPAGGNVAARFRIRDANDVLVYEADPIVVSGSTASATVPEGKLRIGTSYALAVASCQNGVCSASTPADSFRIDPLRAAGDQSMYTYVSKKVDGQTSLKVNVGSGNVMLAQTHLSMAGVLTDTPLAQVYNSAAWAPGSTNSGGLDTGQGWRLTTGQGLKIIDLV